MKTRLVIFIYTLLVLLPQQLSRACGGDWSWEDGFYSFFDQEAWIEANKKPFLLTPESPFYSDLPGEHGVSYSSAENLGYWMDYFPSQMMGRSDVVMLLYKTSEAELKEVLEVVKGESSLVNLNQQLQENELVRLWVKNGDQATLKYFLFANQTQGYHHISSWGTQEQEVAEMKSALKKAKALYDEIGDPFLKQRYGYQVVRLFHYLDRYEEGIQFFEEQKAALQYHSQFYYWILEQAAGMYRSNVQNELASYYFGLVFSECSARREVALQSYRITSQLEWDRIQELCKTSDEKAALYAMRALQPNNYVLEEMENIYIINPESPFLDLLLMREVKKYESDLLHRIWSKDKGALQPADFREHLSNPPLLEFIAFCETVVADGRRKQTQSWEFALGYLHFLRRDFEGARTVFSELQSQLTDSVLALDVKLFKFVSDFAALDQMLIEEESQWLENYQQLQSSLTAADRKVDKANLKDYFFAGLGHLYLKEWQELDPANQVLLAKSFLCGQNVGELKNNPDLAIVQGLQQFADKPPRSKLEEELQGLLAFENRREVLLELEGTAYLRLAIENPGSFKKNLQEAQQAFEAMGAMVENSIPQSHYGGEVVPADGRMFTAFVRNIFNNSNPNDGYKLWKQGGWLDKEFNKLELVRTIFKLDSLAHSSSRHAARYSFLLGNLLYNLTYHGVYRHVLHYEGNPGYTGRLLPEYTGVVGDKSERYNFSSYGSGQFLQNTELARQYYLNALNQSGEKEFKAWCTFMLAKCDQSKLINEGREPRYENLHLNADDRPFLDKFQNEYRDTEVYEEAFERCSYLRLYANKN